MNRTTFAEKRLRSRKVPVIAAAAVAAIADIFVIAVLGVGGFEGKYFALPSLLLVSDAVFIAFSVFTNFRFRYAIALFASYGGLTLFLSAIGAVVCRDTGEGSPITTAALVLWLVMHVVSAAVVVLSCLYAAKLKRTSFTFAAVCMVVILAVAVLYSAFLFERGFFGQQFGSQQRTLMYIYNENTDSYTVNGVMEGKGDTVVIPETFNGKPVDTVEASLFADEDIKSVYIEAEPDIYIKNSFELSVYEGELPDVYVDRSDVDDFRENIYADAKDRSSAGLFELAAKVVPSGLGDGEVYVTFTYDEEAYDAVGGEIFPTWYGEKGDTFEMSEYEEDFPYVSHMDVTSDADLYWNDVNFGGVVLKAPADSRGTVISDKPLADSVSVKTSFEKIYKVYIGEDNDDVYESSDSYKYTALVDRTLNFRYVVADTANDLLDAIPQREGLTVQEWQYAWSDTGRIYSMRGSFEDLLTTNDSSSVIVYPQWKVNEATIAIDSVTGGMQFTYGDEVSLKADATAPADGFALSYSWTGPNGDPVGEAAESLDLGVPTPMQSGEYSVAVTATAPEITSLYSVATLSADLNIDKKTIEFEWQTPSVYLGVDQSVTCVPADGSAVGDDQIGYTVSHSRAEVRDAGSYVAYVTLDAPSAQLYLTSAASASKGFEIAPAEADVTWGENKTFVYDGTAQYPTAVVHGVGEDGDFDATLSGSPIDAGEYTVTASAGGNYILTDPTAQVVVTKRNISVSGWESAAFVYNGAIQYPHAAAVDNAVAGEETSVLDSLSYTVNNGGINAGAYTVTASLPEKSNYNFVAEQSVDYEIGRRTVSISGWNASRLIYNNAEQHPVAIAVNNAAAGEAQTILDNIAYAGGQTEAGSGYVVTPSLDLPNYTLSATSYLFSIARREIVLVWENENSFVYDGTEKSVRVQSATGLAAGHELADLGLTYGIRAHSAATASDAGDYTMYVTLGNANYTVASGEERDFSIDAREATIVWDDASFTYSGSVQYPKVVDIEGDIDSDDLISGLVYDYNGSTNAGSYTVTVRTNNGNYVLVDASKRYSIAQKGVTLTWENNDSYEYNGSVQYPKVTNATGLVGGQAMSVLNITYSGTSAHAGQHTVTAKLGNGNYFIESGASKAYTIAQKGVTLIWEEEREFVYNGFAVHPIVTSATGLVNGDALGSLKINYGVSGGIAGDVGKYTVRATLHNSDYFIESGGAVEFEIVAKQVTLTWNEGDSVQYEFDGEPHAPTVTASEQRAQITYTYYTADGQQLIDKPSAPGSYYVLAQATGNYTSDRVRADFTIAADEDDEEGGKDELRQL